MLWNRNRDLYKNSRPVHRWAAECWRTCGISDWRVDGWLWRPSCVTVSNICPLLTSGCKQWPNPNLTSAPGMYQYSVSKFAFINSQFYWVNSSYRTLRIIILNTGNAWRLMEYRSGHAKTVLKFCSQFYTLALYRSTATINISSEIAKHFCMGNIVCFQLRLKFMKRSLDRWWGKQLVHT